jgi:hypothetical protein
MNSTIPADLIEIKDRFETWRTNRKYVREPIPEDLWNAAADLSRRYPPSLVGRVLKIDPSRLKKFQIKRSARTSNRKKPHSSSASKPCRFYAAHRSEARAGRQFLPFSSPAAASTRSRVVFQRDHLMVKRAEASCACSATTCGRTPAEIDIGSDQVKG